MGNTVIVSDDAGQFRVANHALCWIHAERLMQKLMPASPSSESQLDRSAICLVFLPSTEAVEG